MIRQDLCGLPARGRSPRSDCSRPSFAPQIAQGWPRSRTSFQASDRDSRPKRWAECRSLGQPCEAHLPGRSRHARRSGRFGRVVALLRRRRSCSCCSCFCSCRYRLPPREPGQVHHVWRRCCARAGCGLALASSLRSPKPRAFARGLRVEACEDVPGAALILVGTHAQKILHGLPLPAPSVAEKGALSARRAHTKSPLRKAIYCGER